MLGYGFLEKVYVKALLLELRKFGLAVANEVAIDVLYDGEVVGEYFADLAANGVVVVEVKAARALTDGNEAQLLNYLKATHFEVGVLLNFGPKAEIKRKAFDKVYTRVV